MIVSCNIRDDWFLIREVHVYIYKAKWKSWSQVQVFSSKKQVCSVPITRQVPCSILLIYQSMHLYYFYLVIVLEVITLFEAEHNLLVHKMNLVNVHTCTCKSTTLLKKEVQSVPCWGFWQRLNKFQGQFGFDDSYYMIPSASRSCGISSCVSATSNARFKFFSGSAFVSFSYSMRSGL